MGAPWRIGGLSLDFPDPEKLLNYLIGAVMAKTQGRANPQVVRQLILDRLEAMST